jgi:hypothetical protein
MKTRKQRGSGKLTNQNKSRLTSRNSQIIHCISQLQRFIICFKKGDMARLLQFGYNLGRLQELCGETLHPQVWWKPIETMIKEEKWDDLESYIDELRDALQISYDEKTVGSGC